MTRPTLLHGKDHSPIRRPNSGSIVLDPAATTVQSPQPNQNRSGRSAPSAKSLLSKRNVGTSISMVTPFTIESSSNVGANPSLVSIVHFSRPASCNGKTTFACEIGENKGLVDLSTALPARCLKTSAQNRPDFPKITILSPG